MSSGFDLLAPFYDGLARLLFGSAISASQISYFFDSPPGNSILVVGGGTGSALLPLTTARPDLKIDLVEKSKGMPKKAQ